MIGTSFDDKILVLGAGELGMAVLRGLAAKRAQSGTPRLSVLLRPPADETASQAASDRNEELSALGADIVYVDLTAVSEQELARVLAPFPTVVCCTGFVGGPGTQRRITSAVLAAGVERYVPWQFGVDYDVVGRGSGQAVWDEQLDVREMLRAQSRTCWTIVSTGMFTSFLFEPAFGVVDLEGGRVRALGDWDRRLTVTTSEDIGMLVAAILDSAPPPHDRVIYVAGDTISYREVADAVENVLARRVERVLLTNDQLLADVVADSEDVMAAYRLAFARDAGVAWPKEGTFNAERGLEVVDVATWLRAWRDEHLASGVREASTGIDD